MAGVLLRKREGDLVSQRHVQEGRVKTKAGAGGTQPQTEEHQELEGARRISLSEPWEGTQPCPNLELDFCPLEV